MSTDPPAGTVIDFEISQMVPSYQLKAQPSLVPPIPKSAAQ